MHHPALGCALGVEHARAPRRGRRGRGSPASCRAAWRGRCAGGTTRPAPPAPPRRCGSGRGRSPPPPAPCRGRRRAPRSRPSPRRAPARPAGAPRWGAARRRRPARRTSPPPRPPSARRAGRSRSARSGARRRRRPRRAPPSTGSALVVAARCRGGSGCRRPGAAAAPARAGGRALGSRGAPASRIAVGAAPRAPGWGSSGVTPSSTTSSYGASTQRARVRRRPPGRSRRRGRSTPTWSGTVDLGAGRPRWVERAARGTSPARAAARRTSTISRAEAGDVVGGHAAAGAAGWSKRPPGRARQQLGQAAAALKSAMYQDQELVGREHARANAAGCGTETAVRVRTRSGRRPRPPRRPRRPSRDRPGAPAPPIASISAATSATGRPAGSRGAGGGRAPGE